MKLLFLVIFSSALSAFSQDSLITYTSVVLVDGATKDQLFQRARTWYNESFRSAKDVLQIIDKETGELSGKGILTVPVTYKSFGKRSYTYDVDVLITIKIKDGKYKYTFTNFHFNDMSTSELLTSSKKYPTKLALVSQKKMDELWQSYKDGLEIKMNLMLAVLNTAMTKNTDNDF